MTAPGGSAARSSPPRAPLLADGRVVAVAMATAVATDLTWRAGPPSVAAAGLVAVTAAGLVGAGRLENRQAVALATTAALFGVWHAVRASPWLLLPDMAAAAGLLVLAASLGRGGSLLDVSIPGAAARAVRVAAQAAGGLTFALEPARRTAARLLAVPALGSRWRPAVRGLALAAPVVALLGALLASADAVFAAMLRVDMDALPAIPHLVVGTLGFWAMGGLVRAASVEPAGALPRVTWRLGPVEAATILAGLVLLFAMFAAAQIVALSAGGRRVLETAGLTYAQYARSGFFQLVAVAVITLTVLLSVRALADLPSARSRRAFVALALAAAALTLVVVFVAVGRMDLYEAVYGLTMLRLYVRVFSLWLGAVFVLLALWLLGVGRGRHWLPSVALGVGLAGLLALNTVNPEALVVERNVAHAERTGRFDPAYATSLSEDAIPALVEALPRLDIPSRSLVVGILCASRPAEVEEGWIHRNISQVRAAAALATRCPPGTASPP